MLRREGSRTWLLSRRGRRVHAATQEGNSSPGLRRDDKRNRLQVPEPSPRDGRTRSELRRIESGLLVDRLDQTLADAVGHLDMDADERLLPSPLLFRRQRDDLRLAAGLDLRQPRIVFLLRVV